MTTALMTSEMETLKGKLQATWTAGDFGVIAQSFEKGAEEFAQGLGIQPGMRVLDVACGNGNTAVPAALLGAKVTGIDLAPYVIEQAKDRAAASGVEATFEVGDAEAGAQNPLAGGAVGDADAGEKAIFFGRVKRNLLMRGGIFGI